MVFSKESRLKEIYENPVGKDIVDLLITQSGKEPEKVLNVITLNLKLKMIAKMSKGALSDDVIDSILKLLNNEANNAKVSKTHIYRKWWKEAVIYQIYPRSFKDSNGDGIGDLKGITSKLDYIKGLGADCIWLSPVYDSPNDDNGYDIRDYKKIMKEFGTMEDFDELLSQVHKRNMHLIMDLVVNHTSDEHEWFREALANPDSKYRNYYFIKEGRGPVPNNWTSFFSGSAWNHYDKENIWALHLFSKKQMDLNWDNKEVRKEVQDIVNWWLQKGVDGFRMDVINFISKNEGLPDGNDDLGKMVGITGIENYFYGPNLHKYLNELNEKAFRKYDAFSVGETPGVGLEMAKLLTADERREINMVFNFEQLDMPGHNKFDSYDYDLNYYKQYMIKWMENYTDYGWMSLFYENHDNTRVISKINKKPEYRKVLGKMLAVMQMTLKGTPFIYQGQELGSVNNKFNSIADIRDIESINLFNEIKGKIGSKEAFEKIRYGSRDNARVPMKWNGEKYGGFTDGKPWIEGDNDYLACNVKSEEADQSSVLNFYKKAIELRKNNKALIYGKIEIVNKKTENLFSYYRSLEGSRFYIECNLSEKSIARKATSEKKKLLLSNYDEIDTDVMKPYEAVIYKVV